MLTKHEFRNIISKAKEECKKGNFTEMDYEEFLDVTDKLYDALWEHLKDCEGIEEDNYIT